MAESRTSKSIKNAQVSLFFYFIQLILGFWSRKVFFDYLGTEILGLDTTATNLLSFLNLAEMGVATAVGYFLYKPLYEKDITTINKIVTLQGWIYRRVAFIIIIAASILMLFFPCIFKSATIPLWYAYATFGVMLFNAMLGYFMNYRQIILWADQKGYKVTKVTQSVQIAIKVIQIVCFPFVASPFIFYLATGLFSSVFSCWWINRVLHKEYPWLVKAEENGRELLKEFPEIMKKTRQLFVHGVSAVILFRVSPLIMYAYSSLKIIALYGNYLVVTTQISKIIGMVFSSVGAAVGNLIASGDNQRIIRVFWELYDSRFCITSILLLCVFFLIQPFICIWLGQEYLLSQTFLILMMIDTSISLIRTTVDQYNQGYGLFQDIWAPVTEGIINFSAAIGFGYLWGYKGVIGASILSQGLIICVWKPILLYTKGFHISPWLYFVPVLKRMTIICVDAFLLSFLFKQILPNIMYGYIEFFLYSALVFFIVAVFVSTEFLIFSHGFRDFSKRIMIIVKHKI